MVISDRGKSHGEENSRCAVVEVACCFSTWCQRKSHWLRWLLSRDMKKVGWKPWGKSISDSWNSGCKGLEVDMCLVVLGSSPGGQRDLEWSEQGREQRCVRGCGQVVGSHIGYWKDFYFYSKWDRKPTITLTLEVKMKVGNRLGYYNDPSGQWWKLKPGW